VQKQASRICSATAYPASYRSKPCRELRSFTANAKQENTSCRECRALTGTGPHVAGALHTLQRAVWRNALKAPLALVLFRLMAARAPCPHPGRGAKRANAPRKRNCETACERGLAVRQGAKVWGTKVGSERRERLDLWGPLRCRSPLPSPCERHTALHALAPGFVEPLCCIASMQHARSPATRGFSSLSLSNTALHHVCELYRAIHRSFRHSARVFGPHRTRAWLPPPVCVALVCVRPARVASPPGPRAAASLLGERQFCTPRGVACRRGVRAVSEAW
jgi:hypothetical protein